MSHRSKTLGIVLATAFAVAAIFASSAVASSPGELAPAGEGALLEEEFVFLLDGTEIEAGPVFTGFGEAVECPGSTYSGGELVAPARTIPLTPEFNSTKCHDGSFKATILTNGCHYLFHIGETIGTDQYGGSTDLVCPEGKDVELLIFLSATNENIKACSVTVKPQEGLQGISFTNNTAAEDVVLGGPVTGLVASKSGACGAGETNEARLDFNVTLKGTTTKGEPVGIGVFEF